VLFRKLATGRKTLSHPRRITLAKPLLFIPTIPRQSLQRAGLNWIPPGSDHEHPQSLVAGRVLQQAQPHVPEHPYSILFSSSVPHIHSTWRALASLLAVQTVLALQQAPYGAKARVWSHLSPAHLWIALLVKLAPQKRVGFWVDLSLLSHLALCHSQHKAIYILFYDNSPLKPSLSLVSRRTSQK